MNYYNPYGQPMPTYNQYTQPPKTEVVLVNGREGANAYNIAPNSSALLLDESGELVWLVVTDGAGYKTATPYDIKPHQEQEPVNIDSIEERLKKVEAFINEFTDDTATIEQDKSKSDHAES